MDRAMKKALVVAFTLVAASVVSQMARSAPPPTDSDDYKILSPYSNTITTMTIPDTQALCCSLSDCRPADYRIATKNSETYYEVFIRKLDSKGSGWEDGTNQWTRVPDNVVISPDKRENLPIPVACWIRQRQIDNGFLCFTPGSGS